MIPTSRKPKAVTKKLSTPSPGLNGSINEGRKMNKNDLLLKFQDHIGDDDDIFGTNEGGLNFDDDFNTLKINDLETLKVPQHSNNKSTLNFEHVFEQFDQALERIGNMPDLGMSPIDSISTSSPKLSLLTPSNRLGLGQSGSKSRAHSTSHGLSQITRKTLSEYSEGDDTDVTSQMNEDDFEDLDNIFGAEESGIYEKINQKLVAKKLKLQNEAELEDMELQKRYKKQFQNPHAKDINATIKIKDFNHPQMGSKTLTNQNLSLLDQLENDKTINYEYTRDDFEDFTEGFDNNFEKKLSLESRRMPSRSNIYQPSTMRSKVSMPNLNKSAPTTIKKYKSSMDIVNAYNMKGPGFNYNNNVIRKLDRIPSFYNPKKEADAETLKKKQLLLSKYAENHQRANKSNRESYKNDKSKHKIGLVKYLNNNSVVHNPTIPTNTKSMRYDPANKRWEGNEADLLRFENMHKPSLITLNDVKDNEGKDKNPNMVYDNENLRWVNLNDDSESIFNDIPDLEDFRETPGSNRPALQSPMTRRGLSQFTQRTVSSNTHTSGSDSVDDDLAGEFKISMKLIDRFMKEEDKITKKTHHWFPVNDEYDFTNNTRNGFNPDYYWEIRKMVIDNE
ncbi:uncharacterized protein CANTADRAFT_57254 [Suhomyces tanzawaensis NRRL Y-17324]|uniref:Uncharacterized protein n=1 Tax=Suhomyces tanzawaensis NRRL Y-17324 TaxID=984487 RepID=A0A1E4SBR9_9ASCO|nr:uncharacterized protein CANTADRAFT_57254 [Suhomyces tanzawaensis NRRL Y-17324]ODV76842.1 hypothetical protein CANTADRAFT_57254 [Suhomyces tanzawaensis NRRL Y-17324]